MSNLPELTPAQQARIQANMARMDQTSDLQDKGLFVGESAQQVQALYNQEVRKAHQAGQTIDDYETWVRKRAADRIVQGYTPTRSGFISNFFRRIGL